MSKNKSILLAFGAPFLYMLIQMAVLTSLCYFSLIRSLSIADYSSMSYAELMDASLQTVIDLTAKYNNQIMLASGALFVVVMLLAYRRRSPGLWRAVRLDRPGTAPVAALAALSGLSLSIASSGLLTGLPVPQQWLDAYDALMEPMMSGNPVLTMATVCVLVPFVEELVFRGFTCRLLENAIGPWSALALQALLFAWFHGNPLQFAYTLFAGLLLGLVYMWTRSLWAAVICHMAYNAAGFALDSVLTLFLGDGDIPVLALAAMVAVSMTLVLFCVRSLHSRRVMPPTAV